MRYFGGGIGHLKNTPPLQVPGFDPIDPGSDKMAVEDDDDEPCSDTNDDPDAVVQQPSKDVIMNSQYFTVPHIVRPDSGGLRRSPVTVRWSPLSPVKVRWTPVSE